MAKIRIFTDGACEGNQLKKNFGGWGVVIIKDNEILETLQGAAKNTTNNRMELIAVIKALEYINSHPQIKTNEDKILYSDSAYIVNCLKQRWYEKWQQNQWQTAKKTPVKNPDLWKKLLILLKKVPLSIEKIKAHAGHRFNELADKLAVEAIQKIDV